MIVPPASLPKFSWDNLKVNDDLGRVEGVVSESAVRAHAFAIGDNPKARTAEVMARIRARHAGAPMAALPAPAPDKP